LEEAKKSMKIKVVEYVPKAKRQKKAQKAINASQRGSWNGVNPVSKVYKDKTRYDRKRERRVVRELSDDA
jgi:transposase